MLLGNPSRATEDPDKADNYLLRKPYFALSYNNARGTPNWVSWRLTRDDLGTATRSTFHPDPDLPRRFRHITPRNYTGSGFDRGHLCPRSDRTAAPEAAFDTFAMTNMVPQAPHLNQRAWADFENYCRSLARKGRTLYIVAGPHGRGGEGSTGPAETIADGKVTVPAKCWKVVLVLKEPITKAGQVGSDARLMAVVMPNDQSVGRGYTKYRTSVREVEKLTGYTFFDRAPADVIGPLKDTGED